MEIDIKKTLPWLLIAVILIVGSLYIKSEKNNYEEKVDYTNFVKIHSETPSESTYNGGTREVTRKVRVYSILNPFGVDAGEVIARQLPLKVEEGKVPAVNMGANGISTTEGGGTIVSTGGFEWGIIDSIWAAIKRWLWMGAIGIGVLLLIFFLVPGAAPIIGMIFRAIASVIPFIGSIVERLVSKIKVEKPLRQTVEGGQNFKEDIDKRTDLTDKQKEEIRKMFNDAMQKKQDLDSQKTIKKIKD